MRINRETIKEIADNVSRNMATDAVVTIEDDQIKVTISGVSAYFTPEQSLSLSLALRAAIVKIKPKVLRHK
jgi:hypothetical protein